MPFTAPKVNDKGCANDLCRGDLAEREPVELGGAVIDITVALGHLHAARELP